MKEIIVSKPDKFNLVKSVEKYQGKVNFKEFIKKHKKFLLGSLGIIVCLSIFNISSILFCIVSGIYLAKMLRNEKSQAEKEIIKSNMTILDYSDNCNKTIKKIKLEDFKRAVVYNKQAINSKHWLVDGGGRVDTKKVVSYVAVPKRHKLIVFKQLLDQYKYENPELDDKQFAKFFLLEDEDLINERIVTKNGYINPNHTLGKRLLNTKYYR